MQHRPRRLKIEISERANELAFTTVDRIRSMQPVEIEQLTWMIGNVPELKTETSHDQLVFACMLIGFEYVCALRNAVDTQQLNALARQFLTEGQTILDQDFDRLEDASA